MVRFKAPPANVNTLEPMTLAPEAAPVVLLIAPLLRLANVPPLIVMALGTVKIDPIPGLVILSEFVLLKRDDAPD